MSRGLAALKCLSGRRGIGQYSKRALTSSAHDLNSDAVAIRRAKWHRTKKSSNFVDELRVEVEGGQGGDGCVAFAREKFNPFGPPSGAAGGQGGSVFIRASPSINTLARISHHVVAERGDHGSGDWQAGKKGQDRFIDVPVGTVVHIRPQTSTDESKKLMQAYEELLCWRYRSSFVRSRKNPVPLRMNTTTSEATPIELRAQRDAMWRYYSGAVGHNSVEDVGDADDEGHVKRRQLSSEIYDAESDIRGLGKSFFQAERRLAHSLLELSDCVHDETGDIVFDLDKPTTTPICIVHGGQGGHGNSFFASANNRSPTMASRGRAGQAAQVTLDWKSKGDVGLVGLPNAGKSTFLKSVTSSGDSVRIADYEFTTLVPNVGIVRLGRDGLLGVKHTFAVNSKDDSCHPSGLMTTPEQREDDEEARFTLQDLPGLIEGASANRGLGHEFLKHVERCSALYYIVDVSDKSSSPWEDVQMLFCELEAYRPGLSARIKGVLANKCDLITADSSDDVVGIGKALKKLDRLKTEAAVLHGRPIPIWNVSAQYRTGVEQVARAMSMEVEKSRR